MKRFVKSGLIATCSVAAITVVLAQEAPKTPEQQAEVSVETRQGLQKVMNFQMAPIGAILRHQQPFDAAVASKQAEKIAQLASLQPDIFAADTHKVTGLKTKARDGIWTNKSDFDAKSNDLVKKATDAAAAAKGGDEAAARAALITMGKACGACHDSFKDK